MRGPRLVSLHSRLSLTPQICPGLRGHRLATSLPIGHSVLLFLLCRLLTPPLLPPLSSPLYIYIYLHRSITTSQAEILAATSTTRSSDHVARIVSEFREREREVIDGKLIRASGLEGEAGGHQEAWRCQSIHLHPW